jgi:6-phosphofructokinase 1
VHCREIVKQIDLWGIDMVFVVGGNGGNAGAAAIQEELQKNDILCRCAGCAVNSLDLQSSVPDA